MLLIYFFIFITGAAFGSFFNVCIWRIPRRESIILPASHCPHCNQHIKPWHNIPILSYLFLRGKCHYCGKPINIQYLLLEIITPLVWLLLFWRFSTLSILIWLKYLILYSTGIMIFFIDLKHKIIPDRLSLPLIMLGLGISFIPQMDINILQALGGAAGGFAFLFLLALAVSHSLGKETLGGGDIKFVTALGMFLGFQGILFTIFLSATIALIAAFIFKKDRSSEIPYGPFLVMGAIIHTLLGNWILSSYLHLFY
jgi:leader peptidase (prepilin peptidase)/N-methyltransferase